MIRVLLVDDQPLVRAGLARILGPEPDLEIVGECADGDEVEAAVADASARRRAHGRAHEAGGRRRGDPPAARARRTPPPVLVLTTFDDDATVAAALGAGADGFILKDAPGEDLVRAT